VSGAGLLELLSDVVINDAMLRGRLASFLIDHDVDAFPHESWQVLLDKLWGIRDACGADPVVRVLDYLFLRDAVAWQLLSESEVSGIHRIDEPPLAFIDGIDIPFADYVVQPDILSFIDDAGHTFWSVESDLLQLFVADPSIALIDEHVPYDYPISYGDTLAIVDDIDYRFWSIVTDLVRLFIDDPPIALIDEHVPYDYPISYGDILAIKDEAAYRFWSVEDDLVQLFISDEPIAFIDEHVPYDYPGSYGDVLAIADAVSHRFWSVKADLVQGFISDEPIAFIDEHVPYDYPGSYGEVSFFLDQADYRFWSIAVDLVRGFIDEPSVLFTDAIIRQQPDREDLFDSIIFSDNISCRVESIFDTSVQYRVDDLVCSFTDNVEIVFKDI
jgi:hypothetical protein